MSDSSAMYSRLRRFVARFLTNRHGKTLHNWRDYFHRQPIGGYIGYLGYGNLGDEIMFLAQQALFPKLHLVVYDGARSSVHRDPTHYHPIELVLYRELIKQGRLYDLVFLGGGTLINRYPYLDRFAHALEKDIPGVVFGTGVADPDFRDRRTEDRNYQELMLEWIDVLRKADIVHVRGPHSTQILQAHGLQEVDFIGDPAFSACTIRAGASERCQRVGVNVGSHGTLWGRQSDVRQTLARLIELLQDSSREVVLLPFDEYDLNHCRSLLRDHQLGDVPILPIFRQPRRAIERLHGFDLVVGQRLHSAVLACGCAIPFVLLSYAPKCLDFAASVDCEEFAIRTDECTAVNIMERVNWIDEHYERHREHLVEQARHYRSLQRRAAEQITARYFPYTTEEVSYATG